MKHNPFAAMTTLLLGLTLFTISARGNNPTERYPLWKLVAQSSDIIAGIPDVPIEEIDSILAADKRDYVNITLVPSRILKGRLSLEPVTINYFVENRRSKPTLQILLEPNIKEILFFLIQSDDPYARGLYLTEAVPNAIRSSSSDLISEIETEVMAQEKILRNYKGRPVSSNISDFDKVRTLINYMTIPGNQFYSFAELERMGNEAVPAIIYLMDDYRDLPAHSISLRNNFPDAFEAYRHYGPECIVDALAALLNQITGESSGAFIYNGGSDRERQHTIDFWRIYLYYSGK